MIAMMYLFRSTVLLPLVVVLAFIIALGACASAAGPAPASTPSPAPDDEGGPRAPAATPAAGQPVRLVATSNIVGDWVRRVGGDRVEVFDLVPANADPHTFQPGARDVARVADADLVFTVGLGLEAGWLGRLVESANRDPSAIVALGEGVDPLEVGSGEHDDSGEDSGDDGRQDSGDHDEGEDHDHGPLDPHFWLDPLRVRMAVAAIADRLAEVDPANAAVYQANAEAYRGELDGLHRWIREEVAQVPEKRRVLVTSHDSLGYLADRYGFEIAGSVILGVTTEREPTAREMTALVERIRASGVPAVFTESTLSDKLARRIAEEAGATVERALYTGSLGPRGSGAGTYLGMMRANVTGIVEALR